MKILFVCTGNTCRSCMAEAIFNSINSNYDFQALSAGVSVVYNSKTSKNTSLVLMENIGVDYSERMAIQLSENLIKEATYVFSMTLQIKEYIIGKFPNYKNKIFSLNEFVGVQGDIVDPYGGHRVVYNETFTQLKQNLTFLISKLKEDKGTY